MRFFGILALSLLFYPAARAAAAEPQSTREAFQTYIKALESRLDARNQSAKGFLWIDASAERLASVRGGKMPTERIEAPQISGGTLEHWIGGEFIPGVTLDRVLEVDRNYSKYPVYYAPEMLRTRVLAHEGNHYTVLYRLRKHHILTVVLDVVNQIDYVPLSDHRYFMRTTGEDIREVRNPGTDKEKILPPGEGIGFLWGMNSYWRMEQRDGGVYLECEVVTLGRSIPFGLGGLVRPAIESVAKESLANMLAEKRKAVLSGH